MNSKRLLTAIIVSVILLLAVGCEKESIEQRWYCETSEYIIDMSINEKFSTIHCRVINDSPLILCFKTGAYNYYISGSTWTFIDTDTHDTTSFFYNMQCDTMTMMALGAWPADAASNYINIYKFIKQPQLQ